MPDRPLLRRRILLAALGASGAGGVVALAGCDADPLGSPGSSPSSTAEAKSGAAADRSAADPADPADSTADAAADRATVAAVLSALTAAGDVLESARRTISALATEETSLQRPLAGLLRDRRGHIAAFGGIESESAARAEDEAGPITPVAALTRLRRSERDLRSTLIAAAGRANSGALARLLASTAASVGQHLAVLPDDVLPGGGP